MTSPSGPCPDFLSGCFSCLGGPSFQNVPEPDTPGQSPKPSSVPLPKPIDQPPTESPNKLRKRIVIKEQLLSVRPPTPRPPATPERLPANIYTAPEPPLKVPERLPRRSAQNQHDKTQKAAAYLQKLATP